MNVPDSNPYGNLELDQLLAFESHIGHSLPEPYRTFLLTHNGGKPNPCDFPLGEGLGCLHNVYGLHGGPRYCRLDQAQLVYAGRIPDSMVPIASDPGGNAICIGISDESRGRVFFWHHENESDDGLPYFENITLLADTFADFTARLSQWVDPSETSVESALRNDDPEALASLLLTSADLEREDEYGRTLMENAAIKNSVGVIQYLHDRGARIRNSLQLAQKNAKYFPQHKESVDLLTHLQAL